MTLGELLDAGAALGPEARDAQVFCRFDAATSIEYENTTKRFRLLVRHSDASRILATPTQVPFETGDEL